MRSALLATMVAAAFTSMSTAQSPASTQTAQNAWVDIPAHRQALADAEKSVAAAVARVIHDRLHPRYHFTPPARFMNDPNGCVQYQGVYHMFYQHLPFWGEPKAPLAPGWGHAVSRDLVHWEQWPIALMPVPGTYDAAAVASGACVIDGGQPTIVYTSVPPQAQSLARSFDGMRTWQRFAGNPVIPSRPDIPGLEEGFRDPFVWREGNTWRLVVGSGIRGQGGAVLLYESADLISWRFIAPLAVGMGPDCFQWECPNFFKLGEYWVLIVSPLLHSMPGLRGPVQYTVGKYDGRHFEHSDWHLLDLGGETVFYAPNSLQDDTGRRILWGWLMGGGEADSPWQGMLTVPRELSLGPDLKLRTWPVQELEALRAEPLADMDARELKPGEHIDVAPGRQFDAIVELPPWSSGRLHARLFVSGDNAAVDVGFDLASGELRCNDRVCVLPRNGSDICTLRFLADRSVVEVYADRREVISLRVLPPPQAEGLQLAAGRGPVLLKRVRVWHMADATAK